MKSNVKDIASLYPAGMYQVPKFSANAGVDIAIINDTYLSLMSRYFTKQPATMKYADGTADH